MLIPKRRAAKLIACGSIVYFVILIFGTIDYFKSDNGLRTGVTERYLGNKIAGLQPISTTTVTILKRPHTVVADKYAVNNINYKKRQMPCSGECSSIKYVNWPPSDTDQWNLVAHTEQFVFSAFLNLHNSVTIVAMGKTLAQGKCQLWSRQEHYIMLNISDATSVEVPETHGHR